MITLEPPRTLPLDANPWTAAGLSQRGLADFLRKARRHVRLKGDVDVLIAGDRTLRQLNRDFRGKDKATDVLSFPAPPDFPGNRAGDLAISLETAARQADLFDHDVRDEVQILMLHGLLHLAGMDHEVDAGEMAKRESELRMKLRLPGGLIERVEKKATAKAGPREVRGARCEVRGKATAKATAKAGLDELRAKSLERRGKARGVVGAKRVGA